MIVPCKDCERKGCGAYHSQCEQYQKYTKERETMREQRYKETEFIEFRSESLRKVRYLQNDKNSRH